MTKRKTRATAIAADWLWPYREKFLQSLSDQGYTGGTLRTYAGAASLLCQEVYRRAAEDQGSARLDVGAMICVGTRGRLSAESWRSLATG